MSSGNARALLYIGSRLADPGSGIVEICRVSKSVDNLIAIDQSISLSGVADLARLRVTNDGKFLYAVNSSDNVESRIYGWMLIDGDDVLDAPRYLGSWPVGAFGSCDMTINNNNRFIYVANRSGSVAAFKAVDRGGQLVRCNVYKFDNRSDQNEDRQGASRVTSVVLPPAEDNVYACDAGNDCVWKMQFSRLSGFEFISELPRFFPAPRGSGPGRGVFAKTEEGLFLYIGCDSDHLLVYYVNEFEFGALEQIQYASAIPRDTIGDQQQISAGIIDIQISKDSRFIYTCSRRNVISVFQIQQDGNACLIELVDIDGSRPSSMLLMTTFGMILVANEESSDLLVYTRDEESGKVNEDGMNKLVLPLSPCSLYCKPCE